AALAELVAENAAGDGANHGAGVLLADVRTARRHSQHRGHGDRQRKGSHEELPSELRNAFTCGTQANDAHTVPSPTILARIRAKVRLVAFPLANKLTRLSIS